MAELVTAPVPFNIISGSTNHAVTALVKVTPVLTVSPPVPNGPELPNVIFAASREPVVAVTIMPSLTPKAAVPEQLPSNLRTFNPLAVPPIPKQVVDEPILIRVAAPNALTVVRFVLNSVSVPVDDEASVGFAPFTFTVVALVRVSVALPIVAVPVAAPRARVVAAPKALTVVATVLKTVAVVLTDSIVLVMTLPRKREVPAATWIASFVVPSVGALAM